MSLNLRHGLEAVVAELKRLRAEGVGSVYLTQEGLAQLQEQAKALEADGFAERLATEFGVGAKAPAGSQDGTGAGGAGASANNGFSAKGAAAGSRGKGAESKPKKNPFIEESSLVWPQGESATGGGREGAVVAVAAGGANRAAGDKEAVLAAAQGLPKGVKPIPEPVPFELPQGDKQTRWQWLDAKVKADPVCLEHLKRGKKLVLGVGSLDADIFFCGEAPGEEEESEGEPFVGPAGQLLTKIIQAMGLSREAVYIGNIMNWRPEHDKPFGNRAPVEAEIRYCLPHLLAQLEIVKPKVVVALGLTAANGLLGFDPGRRLGGVRGRWLEIGGCPLMVTYHPSYLLRNGTLGAKRAVWEDLMLVMEKIGMPVSAKQRAFFTKG